MTWKIPLFRINNTPEDADAPSKIVKQGRDWAIGSEIKDFEQAVAEYIGVKYAVACNSGTSALHIAMLAYDIGQGDEVIVPSFTFIATCNAPKFVGATPVFADIEEKTYGLNPEDVERKITERTVAIIAVHYAGMACQIDKLRAIADRHGLILIEDNAEAFGATVGKRKLGSIGDSSILSFCSAKVITTGEGGMFLTNDKDVYERAKLVVSHGRADNGDYFSTAEIGEYITLGFNFRMSTMTAALGLSQLKRVDKIIGMRQANAQYLSTQLLKIKGIVVPCNPCENHVYMLYTIRVPERDALKDYLAKNGILSRIYFNSVHLSRFYRLQGHNDGELPITEKLSKEVLTLPMCPDLTCDEIDEIANTVKEFYARR